MSKERVLSLVAVTGVRGVGKTTVLDRVSEIDSNIRVVSMSSGLKDFSMSQTGKYFFNHNDSTKDLLRNGFSRDLLASLSNDEKPILLDLHFTDIDEGGSKIIQPDFLIEKISHFVILDATDGTILKRRLVDLSRERYLTIESIQEERRIEFEAIQRIIEKHRKTFTIINGEINIVAVASIILLSIDLALQRNPWK